MSDYQNKEKKLLGSISQLYKDLGQLEKNVQEYEIKERRVATTKRTHEGETTVAKRLKSTVIVKSIDEQEKAEPENSRPRPVVKTSEADRARNSRLFGGLLFKPLAEFKNKEENLDENV